MPQCRRTVRPGRAALAVLALAAAPAVAQTPVLPVYGGGFTAGREAGAVLGFTQQESRPGDGVAFGTGVTVGFWRVGIAGTVAWFDPSGSNPGSWSYGLLAGIRLLGGDLSPLAIFALGGAGTYDDNAPADRWYFPLGLAATLTLPTPLLSVKPWIAPRLDIERVSLQGTSNSNTLFGLSAGVDLTLLSGLSFRASYDQVRNFDPIVAFGAALRF